MGVRVLIFGNFWFTRLPVNYAMRFSGPVTSLTARRVRYGV
jgi:hypothetical protein